MFVLNEEAREFFQTFGYAVARSTDLDKTLADLHEECISALELAYPQSHEGNLQLPAMSSETQVSMEFLHHPPLLKFVDELLGPGAVVKPPKFTRFRKPTHWHRDCYMALRGIKIAAYFVDADDLVRFEVIPASHFGRVRAYVDHRFGKASPAIGGTRNPNRVLPSSIPIQTVELHRGELLLFDLGLWHSNLAETERLQWSATFLAAPQSAQEIGDIVSHLGEFFEYTRAYPREVFPYLPVSWEEGLADSRLACAMKSSGVLSEYLLRYGKGR